MIPKVFEKSLLAMEHTKRTKYQRCALQIDSTQLISVARSPLTNGNFTVPSRLSRAVVFPGYSSRRSRSLRRCKNQGFMKTQ